MENAYILQKLASKKKQRQLHFHQELPKLLIALKNGYRRPSNYGKFVIKTVTAKETLSCHFLVKLEGRKKACAMCIKVGRKNKSCTFETSFACKQCGVHLLPM